MAIGTINSGIHLTDLLPTQVGNLIGMMGGGKDTFMSGNPLSSLAQQPVDGTPREWAQDIFQGMMSSYGSRYNVQYQGVQQGDNELPEGTDAGVQYTGEGNNTGNAVYLAQLTEKGDNTGYGKELFQYTGGGTNTASAATRSSGTFQYNENGDNKTDGDTPFDHVQQFTKAGNNSAYGTTVEQYTNAGNNEATGTGDDSYVSQTTKNGDNTATNAQYVYQNTRNGQNTATGTDSNDEIIQRGNGTATGGKGDDSYTVLNNRKGNQTNNFDGGDGYDTLHLYGKSKNWDKTVNDDGTVVYQNKNTGDTVNTKNVEDVKYGAAKTSPGGRNNPPSKNDPPSNGGGCGDTRTVSQAQINAADKAQRSVNDALGVNTPTLKDALKATREAVKDNSGSGNTWG